MSCTLSFDSTFTSASTDFVALCPPDFPLLFAFFVGAASFFADFLLDDAGSITFETAFSDVDFVDDVTTAADFSPDDFVEFFPSFLSPLLEAAEEDDEDDGTAAAVLLFPVPCSDEITGLAPCGSC